MRPYRAALVLALLAVVGACGGSDNTDPDSRREVIRLAEGARSDLLSGRASRFCSRLSEHGRRQVLAFRVDFDDPPPPRCEQVVKRELADAANPRVDVTWPRQLRQATVRV